MGRILVGTASWTDKTLLSSGWYPPEAKTAEDRLRYYASQFPLVEVDATYYAPPAERTVRLWAERTPPGFVFNVKAFSLLTGHPTRPGSLYKNLRDKVPNKRNVYLKDVPEEVENEVWDRFLSALEPLHETGKLGLLLFQFPVWFPPGERNRKHILRARDRCAPMPICVEFRNAAWMDDEHRDATLAFMSEHRIPYVGVDMPQGHRSSMPPILAATGDAAVVRFHGHSERWDSSDVRERFGYLYSEAEMRSWVPRIRDLADDVETTYVVFNNCCADHSQRNAARFADLLPT